MNPLLEVIGIVKLFPGTLALDRVDLAVKGGGKYRSVDRLSPQKRDHHRLARRVSGGRGRPNPSFATRWKFCQFIGFFGPGSRINKGRWFQKSV
jgi:hypothetical protein